MQAGKVGYRKEGGRWGRQHKNGGKGTLAGRGSGKGRQGGKGRQQAHRHTLTEQQRCNGAGRQVNRSPGQAWGGRRQVRQGWWQAGNVTTNTSPDNNTNPGNAGTR